MRVVVAGGGTAGHVYPALTVMDWLREQLGDSLQALYLGSESGMERGIAEAHGFRYVGVPAGQVRGRNPFGAALGLATSAAGILRAMAILAEFKPDVVLATGGYVSIPGVVAAWFRRIASVVYLPDVSPGWAVRAIARLARVVATTTGAAKQYLPGANVVVTGYPVRPGFANAAAGPMREHFGLAANVFTVTVVGGSRGAKRINDAVLNGLPRLLDIGQVLHVTGSLDFERVYAQWAALKPQHQRRYRVFEYLHEDMPRALAAADLIVSRSGASTLGEYPAVGRASLLIPGPFSGQVTNAEYLAMQGAAITLPNEDANDLAGVVAGLAADPERLARLAAGAAAMAKPDAAAAIGRVVMTAAGRTT